ncbi:MAG: hypothetical protein LQ352_004461 [Teloschistes flavicans]|nr:MAG: hypothetical protein LQ352_004461 [Teloschistes flavicans]
MEISSLFKWLFGFLRRVKRPEKVPLLAPTEPLEEEPIEFYCPGGYHPVKLGNTFHDRYKVVRKLGWGASSTVWLAKDLRTNRHVALKILSADAHGRYDDTGRWLIEEHTFEREILSEIASTQLDHPGRKRISKLLDHFEHVGPHGRHDCLVFEVMGRSLEEFCAQWNPPRIPSPILRRVTCQLLTAMDYLHRTCGIIHTDIKPSNILLELGTSDDERERCIEIYFRIVPIPTGIAHDTFDYVESKSLYVPMKNASMVNIQLADFGSACWQQKHLQELIQPELLRAPEILFELAWSTHVDIWNIGVLVFELLIAKTLFHGENINDHLAQMAAFVGPFPQDFICRAANRDLYFTSDDTLPKPGILKQDSTMIPPYNYADMSISGFIKDADRYKDLSLEITLKASPTMPEYDSPLSDEERRDWLVFIRAMLKLDPRARKTAKDLLEERWLQREYDYPVYSCDCYEHSQPAAAEGTVSSHLE